jgi:hypothetical protein
MPDKANGGTKAVTKVNSIIEKKIVLFDYEQYENVILEGQYSYPFTVHLPDWLPQSHLCMNTPDSKHP